MPDLLSGLAPSLADLQGWQMQFAAWFALHPLLTSLAYLGVFTLITALCLPGAAVLMLAAGASLGLLGGTLLATLASALGATLTLWAVRRGLRSRVEARWAKQLDTVNAGLVQRGAWYVLWLRLMPVIPFVPLNLLCGLTQMPARTFFAASFAGMLPGTAVYVNAGAQLAALQSLDELWSPPMLLALGLLLVLATVPLLKPRQT